MRLIWRLLLVLALLALIAAATAYMTLRGSLPKLDGELAFTNLVAPVTILRDDLGVPTVRAANREDLFFAQGVLHGQDRFFQMDLARRAAGGRLSELFGAIALNRDKAVRVHGLSQVADASLEAMPPARRRQLDQYVRGVNAGLSQLRQRPFEYLVLRAQPEPWTARDSLLVALSMFLELTDEEAALDRQRGLMFEALPADAYRWLTTPGGRWDAPLMGPETQPPALPARRWYDSAPSAEAPDDRTPGSNSFAVAGSRTPHGAALLANDMHLGHAIPNIWYRVHLVQGTDDRTDMQAIGVSL
ncbi:MAG: penicillin acylase family protein, partial [Pseudomonadota bacterium]